jgi:hypothetical protein
MESPACTVKNTILTFKMFGACVLVCRPSVQLVVAVSRRGRPAGRQLMIWPGGRAVRRHKQRADELRFTRKEPSGAYGCLLYRLPTASLQQTCGARRAATKILFPPVGQPTNQPTKPEPPAVGR